MVRFSRFAFGGRASGSGPAGLGVRGLGRDLRVDMAFPRSAVARTTDICLVCYGRLFSPVKGDDVPRPPERGKARTHAARRTVIPLILFTALLLVLSLHALAASGQFPREHRAPALASGVGGIVLYGTIAVAITSLVVALLAAWRLIPWYAAVIGGGLAILVAPLVLQQFPDRFVDGRASLLSFAAAGALLALLLLARLSLGRMI